MEGNSWKLSSVISLPVHSFNIFLSGVFTDLEHQTVLPEPQIFCRDETIKEDIDSFPINHFLKSAPFHEDNTNLTEKGIVTTP